MIPLHRLDISGLRAAYAAGETTPAAVVEHYLARIDAHDAAIHAYVEVDRDGARAAAEESGRRIADGTARPLEGVPVAVKANIAVSGLDWNAGMEARRGITAAEDAEAVRRLRAAGAIILGTLNMHEAALGATTDNAWFGRTINPHREGYTPGGSSGGSGAAVSAGLCVASLGTDTMGSVRIPAAYNGVYGIKPTHGTIPDAGLVPLSEWLDSIGPIARSIDDLEVVLAVLAEPAPATSMLTRLVLLDSFDDLDCEPAVLDAYRRALALLEDMPRTALTLHDTAADVRFAGFVVAARELITHLGATRTETADRLSDELRFMLDYADSRSDADVARAETIIDRTRTRVRDAMGSDGVLLMPTAPQAAFRHSTRPPANQSAFTAFANIAGLPAISIPAGLDDDDLPVAVQLVGAPHSEAALIALAKKLDAGLAGFVPSPLM
ncbi:amidase [Sphingomonas cavernae]|uniref:Amidase n=1 Tax=Sphingomonas cavernae TaxID=2320861 RepID=A0A418WRC7_9SPHN|nr:amidase [Sphingomonas cavernae]RJF93818.1 amidase [Sphingomonas cavernae]